MFVCFSLQFQLPLPVMILAFQRMALALETAESQGIMCCSCAILDTSYRGRPRSPVPRSTTVFSGSLIRQPVLVWACQIKKCKHSHPQPTFPLWSLHLCAVIIQHIFQHKSGRFYLKRARLSMSVAIPVSYFSCNSVLCTLCHVANWYLLSCYFNYYRNHKQLLLHFILLVI